MKKTALLIIALAFLHQTQNAQIFGQFYFSAGHTGFVLSSADRTSTHSQGYLTSKYKLNLGTGASAKHFIVDKVNGNFNYGSINDFSKYFVILSIPLSAPCNTNAISQSLHCYGSCVIETGSPATPPQASRYALAAVCDEGVVFLTLDRSGNIVNRAFYRFPPSATLQTRPIITESGILGEYYITGSYRDPITLVQDMYVIKVDVNGTILWSNVYTSGLEIIPRGIIESPYSTSDLLVVGRANVDPALARLDDGFFLKLNSSSGSITSYSTYGHPTFGNNEFYSISPAFSTFGGSDGYVIGGNTQPLLPGGAGLAWMLKLDQNGQIIWNTTISGSYSPQSVYLTRGVTDALERYSNMNGYEYYGVSSNVSSPGRISVYKLDDSGTLFAGGNNEFSYTGGGPMELSFITSINSGGSNDGIQVFGTEETALLDHYAVKAYFNGLSGCNELLANANAQDPGPGDVISPAITIIGGLQPNTCFDINYSGTQSVTIVCAASSIAGGSNLKTTGIEDSIGFYEQSNMQVHPNPTNGKIYIDSEMAIIASIQVYDNVGRCFGVPENRIMKESNGVSVDFSSFNLAPGIYFMGVKTAAGNVYKRKIVLSE